MAGSGLSEERATVSGICGILKTLYSEVCRHRDAFGVLDREGCAVCVSLQTWLSLGGGGSVAVEVLGASTRVGHRSVHRHSYT